MTSNDINLRTFQNDDLLPIASILVDAFDSKFSRLSTLNREELRDYIIDSSFIDIVEPNNIIIATIKNEVVGILSLKCNKIKILQNKKMLSFNELVKKYGLFNTVKLGLGTSLLKEEEKNNACYIDFIAVKKEHRSKGIGSKLIAIGCEITFNRLKKQYLTLYVSSKNIEAIKLYKNLGFNIVKKTRSFLTFLAFKEIEWSYMILEKYNDK